MDGTVVSRSELFGGGGDSPEELAPTRSAEYAIPSFEFEEVSYTAPAPEAENDAASAPEEALEFQLFGGAQPVRVDLIEKVEVIEQGRPDSYYFYRPSDMEHTRARAAAVTGELVAEAAAWARLAARNPIARDVNADWVRPKRRCRPGKAARTKKKQRNERLEAERKLETERWMRRKRALKARAPRGPQRPTSGFTFR